MARLAYYAPGVYVEEVPSARQPIAGVGTNTVGFIGIVPDTIYVPVANPDYDPVLTKNLLDYKQLTAAQQAGADQARADAAEGLRQTLNAAVASLNDKVTTLTPQVAAAQNDAQQKQAAAVAAEAAAAAASEDEKPDANRALTQAQRAASKAATKLTELSESLDDATRERDALKAQLDAAAGGGGGGGGAEEAGAAGLGGAGDPKADEEDLTYDSAEPPDEFLRKSVFRPYYLVPFQVQVEEFATKLCTNFSEYSDRFGGFSAFSTTPDNPNGSPSAWKFSPLHPGHHLLTHAVDGFFKNGGTKCFVARVKRLDDWTKVLDRFESIDDVAIIAAPGLPKMTDIWGELQKYCEKDSHQNVFAILDSPAVVNDGESNDFEITKLQYEGNDPQLPRKSTHAAFYFPHIEVSDPAKRLQDSDPARQVAPKYRGRTHVAPSGHVAGIYARTDEERGVHKAPANATVRGALEVKYYISKPMQEGLNPQGVNCIRLMNGDVTVWGARTIGGDRNGEWKYVSVRRFAGFLEESIEDGTQWIVFEPNDPNLWSRIILNITAFLTNVWRSGALFGLTPQEAFYVKCDAELNPPEVRDLGQVITEIGVAIVRPAEFVIFRITQSTGQRQG